MKLLCFFILIMASTCAYADQPTRTLTPEDLAAISVLEKAKFLIKDVQIGKQKINSVYDKKIADIKKYGIDQANYRQRHGIVDTPLQTKPLKECIKPNNFIDEEVNLCMNHKLKKYW